MLSKEARRVLLAIIIAIGAGLRFWSVRFGLPHDLARPDEEKIAAAALGILGGDFNPHFFLYPSLFIYLTAGAYELFLLVRHAVGTPAIAASLVSHSGIDDWSLHVAARMLSALAGVVTIGALYAAARAVLNERAALAAAALLAVTFLHVRDSHFGVTDVTATLLVVLAVWAATRCLTGGTTRGRAAATGVLCGLAASTKYNVALAIVPAVVAIAGSVAWHVRASAVRAVQALVLLGVGLVLGFLIGTPFAVLDRVAFLKDVDAQRHTAMGTRHGMLLDAARQVLHESGWHHHLGFSLWYGLGVPLLVVALAGACWLVAARRREAAFVLAFPVLYFVVMGVSQLAYARWMVPVVPFMCLTAGALIDRVADLAGSTIRVRYVPAIVALGLVVAVGAPTLAQSIAFDRLMAKTDTRVLAARWIESELSTGATVYQTGTMYGQLQPRPADRYPKCGLDSRSGRFTGHACPMAIAPDLVVVLDSPLTVFDRVPAQLPKVLDANYELAARFRGINGEDGRRAVYDQQDAFYAPFGGFSGIPRPGPDVRIFVRRTPAVHLAPDPAP